MCVSGLCSLCVCGKHYEVVFYLHVFSSVVAC